jgi:hypothetical protein
MIIGLLTKWPIYSPIACTDAKPAGHASGWVFYFGIATPTIYKRSANHMQNPAQVVPKNILQYTSACLKFIQWITYA